MVLSEEMQLIDDRAGCVALASGSGLHDEGEILESLVRKMRDKQAALAVK